MTLWVTFVPVLLGAAAFAFYIWWQVRGLMGIALAVLAVALAANLTALVQLNTCRQVVDTGILYMYACDSYLPVPMILRIRRVADVTQVLALLVAIDAYAARHNTHRAVTTVAYRWFIRAQTERRPGRDERNEVRI